KRAPALPAGLHRARRRLLRERGQGRPPTAGPHPAAPRRVPPGRRQLPPRPPRPPPSDRGLGATPPLAPPFPVRPAAPRDCPGDDARQPSRPHRRPPRRVRPPRIVAPGP